MITLIYDTETTGLTKHPNAKSSVQPRIIEWAGILVNEKGEEIDSLSILINPKQKLDPAITRITGLTDKDLRGEPTFDEVANDFIREMFERADAILAHNLPFDKMIMELELSRFGIMDWPWPKIEICTVQEHAEEWGRRPKLTELFEHYMGIPLQQTHRALDDIRALAEVSRAAGVLP